ncbi:FBD-associated F-box protein At4g10400-like [Rhododendron vialii]|uniref:FBD-associated F-box protein At4g10400-like n=1 Tax=Rhododendron vialii TaxID=182163 RepID=UPI002660240B|nr:FBD-associated F-box protein At4g10400-like [Rhododendron vialii]XP_058220016.1 FBD-associated F-box protein At4g10400-like [Rhododendron vialii]
MDLDFGRSLDRISKLPDSVLCHILSFLPTKYAVGTSILSTRWQYLWISVATLDFNNSELFNKRNRTDGTGAAEVDLRFMNFVNTVLLLSDVSCLEKFNLKLESFCYFGIVKAWISNAIKRNVQKLELCYSARHNFDEQIPIQLPHMLFICKTMVDLRLNGNISLKVPASVWLPNLKILEIKEVIYENKDSAHNLIHGCPALEDLYIFMSYFDKQKVLNISVPTLKRLVLTRLGDDGHPLFSEHKLTVNTPKLEYLDIADDVAVEFSLENLSSLLDARINVGPCCSGSISSSNLLKLLHGIANVKFLRFSSTNSDDYVLPTINSLHNLTYLGLQNVPDGWNKDLLNVFLEYSPNLEVLVLEGNIGGLSDRPWSPPPRVPSCLLLNLKEIKYLKFGGDKHEFEVIEYLLKSAEVLKNMTICCQHSDSWRLLARFPRASKICELNLR